MSKVVCDYGTVKVGQAAVQGDVVRRARVHQARQVKGECHELVKIQSASTAACKVEAFSDLILGYKELGYAIVFEETIYLGQLNA